MGSGIPIDATKMLSQRAEYPYSCNQLSKKGNHVLNAYSFLVQVMHGHAARERREKGDVACGRSV
jgi:hypothetical protein